jgi:hypothetical protein
MEMQQSTAAFAEAGHIRALEVDLAVERHQQLHGLQLLIARAKRLASMDKLVGEVFDRMAKNLKGMPRLRRNAAALGA